MAVSKNPNFGDSKILRNPDIQLSFNSTRATTINLKIYFRSIDSSQTSWQFLLHRFFAHRSCSSYRPPIALSGALLYKVPQMHSFLLDPCCSPVQHITAQMYSFSLKKQCKLITRLHIERSEEKFNSFKSQNCIPLSW